MIKLINKIEHVMRKADPFRGGNYYLEARIMVGLLHTWSDFNSDGIRDLCEETFGIHCYEPTYEYDSNRWETLVTQIRWLLEKQRIIENINENDYKLLATAMSPERINSITEPFGPSAANETIV